MNQLVSSLKSGEMADRARRLPSNVLNRVLYHSISTKNWANSLSLRELNRESKQLYEDNLSNMRFLSIVSENDGHNKANRVWAKLHLLTGIESVELVGFILNPGIIAALGKNRQLRTLALVRCEEFNKIFISLMNRCQITAGLTELKLSSTNFGMDLVDLFKEARNLERLTINPSFPSTWIPGLSSLAQTLNYLNLDLTCVDYEDICLGTLGNSPFRHSLKTLILKVTFLDTATAEAIANLTNVEELHLSCKGSIESVLGNLTLLQRVVKFSLFEEIPFMWRRYSPLSDTILLELRPWFGRLTSLSLGGLSDCNLEFGNSLISALLEEALVLEHLHLDNAMALSDSALLNLAGLESLRRIEIRNQKWVTAEGIESFLYEHGRIQELRLDNCVRVDWSICGLVYEYAQAFPQRLFKLSVALERTENFNNNLIINYPKNVKLNLKKITNVFEN